MTVKLLLLKSGEDIIADIQEMIVIIQVDCHTTHNQPIGGDKSHTNFSWNTCHLKSHSTIISVRQANIFISWSATNPL